MEEALRRQLEGASTPAKKASEVVTASGAVLHVVNTDTYSGITAGTPENTFCKAAVQIIMSVVELRDAYTARHMRRVSEMSCAIAGYMGLSTERIDGLHMASLVHDIGKISVPADILCKPTRLSEPEYALIKMHSFAGYQILKDIETPWPLARIVLEHHERINGTGYPNGKHGEDILLESRILSVADVVDAIMSHRPYRPSLGMPAAISELKYHRGSLYDDDVVEACLMVIQEECPIAPDC